MNKLSCIILTYNALSYTKNCISCFMRDKDNYNKLVIVDNGSQRETKDYLIDLRTKNKDKIIVILNPDNKGFPVAVNQAIKEIDVADDILISNNDIEFEPGTIRRLHKRAYSVDDSCGIAVPRQISTKGDLLCANSFTLPVTYVGYSNGNEQFVNQYNRDFETDVAMFCFTIIKREVLDKVGLLSEDYFAYAEDSDYCVRTQQNGYKVYYIGTIDITHHHNITTKENKLNLDGIRRKSVETFKNKHEKHFEDRYEMELGLQCALGHSTGYSKMSEYFMQWLNRSGIKIFYSPIYGIPYHGKGASIFNYNDEIATETEKIQIPNSDEYYYRKVRKLKTGGIQLLIGQADVFSKNSGNYKIGFTMFDTDRWDQDWVEVANEMHEIFIPTKEGIEIARASGVTEPILTYMPLGVDPNYFHPEIRPLEEINFIRNKRALNFVSIFEFGERKQPELMIHAWHKAFHDNPDIALFVKHTNADPNVDVKRIISIAENDHPYSKTKIHFVTGVDFNGITIPECFMGSFMKCFDGFYSPTAGEGFLVPAIDSLAIGMPVAITGKFGYLPENKDIPGVTLFDYNMELVTDKNCRCKYYHGSRWAKPKEDDVIDKLRNMVNNIEQEKEKALEASKIIRERLSWENIVRTIMKPRLLEINENFY